MERLLKDITHLKLDHCYNDFEKVIKEKRNFLDHAKGNFFKFQQIVNDIPKFRTSLINLDSDAVTIGKSSDISLNESDLLNDRLLQLCPWRKGPFKVYGIDVDSEWQSWMKWDRFKKHLPDLKGRRILDIGSSNGYYMFRMAAQNPLMVLGLEPQSSFYFQYLAVQKLLNQRNVYCLPIPHDQLPGVNKYFDLVFCMGVLYHRKSPIEMLKSICDSMQSGGELVLENLVLDSKKNLCLFPESRYAKMRNVFFIPDLLAMESWLKRAGFSNIRCIDISKTSLDEQRKTKWIQTETLKDFLDPKDDTKTIEGYPAPVRAIFMATAS